MILTQPCMLTTSLMVPWDWGWWYEHMAKLGCSANLQVWKNILQISVQTKQKNRDKQAERMTHYITLPPDMLPQILQLILADGFDQKICCSFGQTLVYNVHAIMLWCHCNWKRPSVSSAYQVKKCQQHVASFTYLQCMSNLLNSWS
jgi:hypothetical protein